MQITPPFGYKEVVPLLKNQKIRLPAPGDVPDFAQSGNAIPISHTEFQLIAREYPIVFSSGDDGKTFAAVAVLGMTNAENLFVTNGIWAPGVYVPAYARRYPFCMAKVAVDKVEQKDRLICVEKAHVDEQAGEAMFDDKGQPSQRWTDIERLLSEYEADLERSREMCAIFSDYGLLEPFAMQAKMNLDGATLQLAGMYRIKEKNLENLNAAQLKNLMRKGYMARAYMHLLSLENFSKLLDRKSVRRAAA
jgi:hypothetical protein